MKGKNLPESGTAQEAGPTALCQLQSASKKFEKDIIGDFVLKLYHDQHIQSDGLVHKKTVYREYSEYIKANSYEDHVDNKNVGSLLGSNNFLNRTAKGSEMFRIQMRTLFQYRNKKIACLDESRITNNNQAIDSLLPQSSDISDKPLELTVEVSPDAEEFPVIYQGGCKQHVVTDFVLTSMGCYICQQNFKMQSQFEDHISMHGFDSDFEYLSTTEMNIKNIFVINYRLCNASHYFSFTMKTNEKDIVIEKIIIVQTRLMHYVKNHKVPFEIATDGMDSFLVDSHLFTLGVEQPIVVVYRHKFDKSTRFVEQHHFLRTDEFPAVHFPTRSYRLTTNKILKTKLKLEDYFPSSAMKLAQKEQFSVASLSRVSCKFQKFFDDGKILNTENICEILSTLLQIEDLEGMRDYITLRQKAAKIKRFGREYSVKLRKLPKNVFLENIVTPLDEIILILSDGNAENDLTKLDETLLSQNSNRKGPDGKRKKLYFAMVEKVNCGTICFKYERGIINEKKLYDIILRPSRLALKYQHRALTMLSANLKMRKFIFPTKTNFSKQISTTKDELELFNPTIKNNPEQLQAVQNIADGGNSFAPYVIFGPPGTGKTSTIVEAVLQLWQRHPESHILIAAGSNSACDEVAIRLCRVLIDLQPEKPNILRIFAKSNEKRLESIEDILIESSNFCNGHFYPDLEAICQYRIVVCTLSVVGRLVTGGIGTEFFTHVFIDECAASTQPEVLVGWVGTSSSRTRLIVSGDHKQLGPILRSKRAGELGLDVSFMERLMNEQCYAVDENGDYDRSIQTRLIQNFRSHPEIVNLYNNMYYDGELKAMAKEDDTAWALRWHMLPKKNHPIIFHSVYGSCRKSGTSVSLCNESEVSAVMDYVKDLMYFGIKGRKIEETDIGIISPYKKQYIRIQEELNERRWHHIEVGAVETFQGKEKSIIIVSTVRSFTKTLGFLENPRRLNVILSRAKSLLIIIGNPITLSKNQDFKHIIDECRRKECTVGGFRGYNEDNSTDEKEHSLRKESLVRPVLTNALEQRSSVVPKEFLTEQNNLNFFTKSQPTTTRYLREVDPNFLPELIVASILTNKQPHEIPMCNQRRSVKANLMPQLPERTNRNIAQHEQSQQTIIRNQRETDRVKLIPVLPQRTSEQILIEKQRYNVYNTRLEQMNQNRYTAPYIHSPNFFQNRPKKKESNWKCLVS